MKKILLMSVAMTAFTIVTVATNDRIPGFIIKEFEKQFGRDMTARWEKIDEPDSYRSLYVAHFIGNGIWSEAFFEESGEYIGIGKNITELQLPPNVSNAQKDKYKGYDVMEVYEYLAKDATIPIYGITVANRDRRIFLKISESGIFSVVKKEKYKN